MSLRKIEQRFDQTCFETCIKLEQSENSFMTVWRKQKFTILTVLKTQLTRFSHVYNYTKFAFTGRKSIQGLGVKGVKETFVIIVKRVYGIRP